MINPEDIIPRDKQSNGLTIAYELALDDLMAFEKYRLGRTLLFNKWGFVLAVVLAVIFTFLSPGSITTYNESGEATTIEQPLSWSGFFFSLLPIVAIGFVIKFFIIEKTRTYLHGEQWWRGRREIVLAEDSLITDSKDHHAEFKYSAFERFIADKHHLFILLASNSALVIPKRAFGSHERFDAFTDTLDQKIITTRSKLHSK